MLTIGWIAGLLLYLRRGRRAGLPEITMIDVAIAGFIGSIVGARLAHVIQLRDYYLRNPVEMFKIWQGGLVAYGGILLGVGAGVGLLLIRRVPVGKFVDAAAPALWLGLGFTRVGCFFNGCDFGRPSSLPWAVRFPLKSKAYIQQLQDGLLDSTAPMSLAVHPTQLYSSLLGFGLCAFLVWFDRGRAKRFDGATFLLGLMIYAVGRYIVEILRADVARGFIGPFSTSQAIGIPVFVVSAALFLRGQGRSRRRAEAAPS